MKKQDLFTALEEYLELSNLNEDSSLALTSIDILSVIALIDENFDMQIKASELKDVKSVSDLILLIGTDKFEA